MTAGAALWPLPSPARLPITPRDSRLPSLGVTFGDLRGRPGRLFGGERSARLPFLSRWLPTGSPEMAAAMNEIMIKTSEYHRETIADMSACGKEGYEHLLFLFMYYSIFESWHAIIKLFKCAQSNSPNHVPGPPTLLSLTAAFREITHCGMYKGSTLIGQLCSLSTDAYSFTFYIYRR